MSLQQTKQNKTKSLFFEKINSKTISHIHQKKKKKNQINQIRNENREITTNNIEMQRIIRDYYQELYANKMDSLKEMDEFLEKYNLPKLNQETYKILADLSPAWK